MARTPFKPLLVLLGGSILFPLSSPAPLTGYLKIEEIPGESESADHKDWIIIEAVSSGGIELDKSSGLATGKRKHKPFTVIKEVDKASPLLMESLANCTEIESITFEAVEPYPNIDGTSRRVPYYRYELKNVQVTSYQINADPGGNPGQPVIEEVVLEFPYAEWHVRQLDLAGNEVIDSAGAFFDMELNEAGPASLGPVISQVADIDTTTGETFEFDVRIRDFDTPFLELLIGNETDTNSVKVGPIRWMAPEMLRFSLSTTSTASGQVPFTLFVSDGADTASMSFSIFVDSTGTPWDGFLMAYFTEEERANPNISSPIADPDRDRLDTLLEFLLGTNPREFTEVALNPPPESPAPVRVSFPNALDPDDDGDSIGVDFDRRIDDPRITLHIEASFDGGDTWTRLSSEPDNPLYEENANQGENPLFESVSGSVNPPSGTTGTLLRFVGVMDSGF